MVTLLAASAIVTLVIAVTFLPFVPGGHDPLAAPLSAIAWALGRVGLLLVPIGGLWLRQSAGHGAREVPPPWLVRVTLGTALLMAVMTVLVAFASSGSLLLAAITGIFMGLLIARVRRRLRGAEAREPIRPVAPAALILAPLVVVVMQSALAAPIAAGARNRAIENAAPLIAEIEQYRSRRGAYPESLFSIWGDYKASVVGIERYHYERHGEAYNVIFKEPALGFGLRQFVVYNPRDAQRVTVHEHDRLLLDEAALDADNAGHTVVQPLAQRHWKAFLFLS